MKNWNGRFREPLDPDALAFSSSLAVDRRLFSEDIAGSIAHVEMLAECNILSAEEATIISEALRAIEMEIASGEFRLSLHPATGSGAVNAEGERFVAEDVHMAIEHRLMEKIGPLGGKLHTARSRNDQVALDERLFLRQAIIEMVVRLQSLQREFVAKAEEYIDVVMPGYTHLQRAQPILLAHHLLAYVSMLDRDVERFQDCQKRVTRSPLGAAALAGTSFPIDRNAVAEKLGFPDIIENSIDAVSDRDVQIEYLGACAITMMHLSRFSEELILWSSQEWRFASIGESFSTGSSIMPQKKNPDMAELIRGKTGRVYGDLIALLTTMKGLPLAYNRDMQEDKESLFDAADTTADCLDICAAMLRTVAFTRDRFEAELQSDFLLATEIADYLVRNGSTFRDAHAVTGAIVRDCQEKNITLQQLSLDDFRQYSPLFNDEIHAILNLRSTLERKSSAGSTAPGEVSASIRRWKKILKQS